MLYKHEVFELLGHGTELIGGCTVGCGLRRMSSYAREVFILTLSVTVTGTIGKVLRRGDYR